MALESMLVSNDWEAISVLGSVLGNLHIGIHVDPEPESARQRMKKAKYDAVIIDCDLQGAADFFRGLQAESTMKGSVPLAISGNSLGVSELSQMCARFVLQRPVSLEQAVRTLSAARNLMLRGRLRYFRQQVQIPAVLTFAENRDDAVILNISQGGVALHASQPLEIHELVRLRFDLPDSDTSVDSRGEVAWVDESNQAGIRFTEVTDKQQRNLEQWLAAKYFARVNA